MDKNKLRGIACFLLDEKNVYTNEKYTYDDFFNLPIVEQRVILDMINWCSKQRHHALRAIYSVSEEYSSDEEKQISSKKESEDMAFNNYLFPIGEA